MGASRLNMALERIERALARIESAAAAPSPPPAGENAEAQQALRAKVEEAIARIDGLLERAEQD